MSAAREAFRVGTATVEPGARATIDLPVSVLSNHTPIALTVQVVHGREPGPVLFLSAAVHGDEVSGVEIIRRVLRHAGLRRLAGTVIAVPIVNAFGFIAHSRYLPDRRDLNRSFPGSDRGSLASVLAELFLREVVERSNYGVDLHSAALHRSNLPQIRIHPGDPELWDLAAAFGAPVILISKLREGSLRQWALQRGVKVLLYEGGEALRFEESAIRAGVSGILRVLHSLAMIPPPRERHTAPPAAVSHSSTWVRAPEGGIFRTERPLGGRVMRDMRIGSISDPFGRKETPVVAPDEGIIIGLSHLPVVNRGDALFHVARITAPKQPDQAHAPQFDEDEII
jgi:predicted deacylase